MSVKTKRRLNKFSKVLAAVTNTVLNEMLHAIELVMIDLVFGKSKYRKRGARMRPIIHRTYNRTVYIRREMLPTEQLHTVKAK